LAPWASRRRQDLLELLDRLNPMITELTQAIEQEVEKCPEAPRLRTHPGVGALTALAFVLIIGRAERFQCGKQIASYLGLVSLEDSSGKRRRLGHIAKQVSSMLRFLLVEAGQTGHLLVFRHVEFDPTRKECPGRESAQVWPRHSRTARSAFRRSLCSSQEEYLS
jgi:transposase